MERMAEEALWKMAALTYVREVQEPRAREGVMTPDWSWKDLRTHFLLHCCDPRIARLATCRQLQTMRYAVEQRLMRIDGEEREVDKGGCDLMLKVRTLPSIPQPLPLLTHTSLFHRSSRAESDQRNIIAGGGGSGSGNKKQPGGTTVGDSK